MEISKLLLIFAILRALPFYIADKIKIKMAMLLLYTLPSFILRIFNNDDNIKCATVKIENVIDVTEQMKFIKKFGLFSDEKNSLMLTEFSKWMNFTHLIIDTVIVGTLQKKIISYEVNSLKYYYTDILLNETTPISFDRIYF